jgi:tRNA(adenine34) deaminase
MQRVPTGFRFTFSAQKFNCWSVRPNTARQRNRSSVVCFYGGCLLTVKLEDPLTKVIRPFPPGGAIEPGESYETAAIRETLEETGYLTEIDSSSVVTVDYPFTWGGQVYQCHTIFYRARLLSLKPQTVNDASYHRGVFWLPENQIASTFAYHSTLLNSILALQ